MNGFQNGGLDVEVRKAAISTILDFFARGYILCDYLNRRISNWGTGCGS